MRVALLHVRMQRATTGIAFWSRAMLVTMGVGRWFVDDALLVVQYQAWIGDDEDFGNKRTHCCLSVGAAAGGHRARQEAMRCLRRY